MTAIKEFLEIVNYRITEGSDYCWQCFGPYAYSLYSWNGEYDGHSVRVIFDTKTQEVYQLEACDYLHNRAYRWTNPEYLQAHNEEAQCKCPEHINQAWDDVDYVDLETTKDFFTKAQRIVQGLDYDTRVSIPIDLPDNELFELMKLAHEQDITLNRLAEQILIKSIKQQKVKE